MRATAGYTLERTRKLKSGACPGSPRNGR
jgi:hypothetical protein